MTGAQADDVGRRMSLHLRRNNFEACHGILSELEWDAEQDSVGPAAIAELPIELRLANALEGAGYIYVDELKTLDEAKLRAIPNVGPKQVANLIQVLENLRAEELAASSNEA